MFVLPAKISHTEAPALALAMMKALAAAGQTFAVDARALREFDSSALALLLQLQRQAQQAGALATVERAPAKLLALASIYGVQEVLPSVQTA